MSKLESSKNFIRFMLDVGVLRFGDFTTKSGRQTPYFVNTGAYRSGSHIRRLSEFYADAAIEAFGRDFDNLYGPAYKGIPLAAATALTLEAKHQHNVTFTYNRKEAKDHGEGGSLVGDQYENAEPKRIVIIEDVTTAGTSVYETMERLKHYPHVEVVGLLVSVDRQERGRTDKSALSELSETFGFKTCAIIKLQELIAALEEGLQNEENWAENLDSRLIDKIRGYYKAYGGL